MNVAGFVFGVKGNLMSCSRFIDLRSLIASLKSFFTNMFI